MSWRRARRVLHRVWILAGVLFMAWMIWSFQAHGLPADTFDSGPVVQVERRPESLRFRPTDSGAQVGVVFLPGGLVDPDAYAPLARAVARAGYPVGIVRLPLRMARTEKAEQEVAARARILREEMAPEAAWVLAGHSRGAAIATRLVAESPTEYDGVALIGTTHPRVDLTEVGAPIYKIGGTNDCVAPQDRSDEAAGHLPPQTEWHWIEGANHAQFGWYGRQLGDCGATIDRDEQQQELLRLMLELLDRVAARAAQ